MREAARQTLQLSLVQAGRSKTPSPTGKSPVREERSPKSQTESLPLGTYRVVRNTKLLRESREDADAVAELHVGARVNVVAIVDGKWLKIESAHAGPSTRLCTCGGCRAFRQIGRVYGLPVSNSQYDQSSTLRG